VASSGQQPLIESDIGEYLRLHERKSFLRFITCGSVDDGKSTLIGRLLYDSKLVFEDHLTALEVDSKKVGTQGSGLDFALLVDGLVAEREQGITIDVAYRFFSTERRKFVVADTPGHEQYTRNMVTGASTADLAVILVDARKGMLTQTRRHAYLAALLGIRSVILAVNKLDLVGYSQAVFNEIEADYSKFADQIGLRDSVCIPLSALLGDNVTEASSNMPWYHGPTLMEQLESVDVEGVRRSGPFRMPVQWVNRPGPDFRGYSGTIVGGAIGRGDPVRVLPSGIETTVTRIVTSGGDVDRADAEESVTLVLADEVDASRGDVIASATATPAVADQFEAHIVWMDQREMVPGRGYLAKIGCRTTGINIAHPKYKVNVNTLERTATNALEMNEIGVCNISLDTAVPFDPYVENRDMGGFIVIDRVSNDTVGVGLLHFALRRSDNVQWQTIEMDKARRSAMKRQRPCVVWFTGLSGAGKSTIANFVERKLWEAGQHTYLLDGDNVRLGLNHDLGFTEPDRVENIRRVAEVSKLMVDAGLIVLASFISPFRAEREFARGLVEAGEFCEVFVDASLEIAEGRDPKGLYRKARAGELANFTGIGSPYESPAHPELRIDTAVISAEEGSDMVIAHLRRMGIID
jgi:bifunctional enzyme CysN/CysC